QAIFALPSGQKAKVARISTFDGDRDEAFPPQAVTVCLDRDLDVGRGEMLVQPRNLPRVGRAIEAMVIWMHPTPLVLGRRIAVKHLTRWVNATVVAVRHRIDLATIHRQDATTLGENEIGRVALELTEDIAFDPYARNRATGALILVDPDDNATLGAALILERGLTRKSLYGDNRKSLYGDNHDTNAARSDDATSGNTDRISPSERQTRLGQRPCTLWIEGATAADIITLARRLERRLFDAGRIAVFIDPSTAPEAPHTEGDADARHHHDATRLHLAKQARMLNDAGLIAIVAVPLTGGGDPAESSMGKRVAAIVGKDRLVPLRVDVDPGSNTDIEADLSAGNSNPVPKQDAPPIERWTTLALAYTRLGDSDET
ncbi:MAG: hypothetical protein KAI47_14520, partial [Deltaproteobacteria bacterium]|nr:hypothetical protein [Deltaproteobacteria bacterium]